MNKYIVGFSLLVLLTCGLSLPSFASAESGEIPYSIEPVLPSNQDNGVTRYISISSESKSIQQELEFLVTNKSDEDLSLDVELLNAYTSANGGIQYSAKETDNNVIINDKYEMQQYLKAPDKVELKGQESKVIKVDLNISEAEGTVLGGVAFKRSDTMEESATNGISLEIKNEVNKVYGVVVNFPTKEKAQFEIDQAYLDTMPSYYVFRLPITLNSPVLLKGINLAYEVDLEGKELFSSTASVDYAPMTKTNFAIPFEYKELLKDKPYTLKGEMSYIDQNGEKQVHQFEEVVKYQDKENGFNELVSQLKKPLEKNGTAYTVLPFFLIPFILFIFFLIYRRKKKKKDEEDNNKNEEKSEEIA